MTTTALTATVLPYSVDPAAPFHVSLMFSHRLTGSATLSDYPAMLNWVQSLHGASFALHTDNSATPIASTPQLGAADENAWANAFPAGTAVRDYVEPAVTDTAWKSYPANRIPDHALDAHQTSLLSNPASRPSVTTSPLAGAVLTEFAAVEGVDGGEGVGGLIRELQAYRGARQAYLDAVAGQSADNAKATAGPNQPPSAGQVPPTPAGPVIAIKSATVPVTQPTSPIRTLHDQGDTDSRVTGYLDKLADGTSPGVGPAAPMLRDAHLTRGYYLRPEEQRPPGTPLPPLPPVSAPDFHERVSAAGNVPALLRSLGLVVDLHVDAAGLATFAAATRIWCEVTVPDTQVYASPATACAVVNGRFIAVPTTANQWVGGYLRVGDDTQFTVLDLDPDAGGLSLEQLLRSAIRATAVEANGDPGSFAPSSLRSTGFAIAEIDRPTRLKSQLQGAEAAGAAAATGGSLTDFHYEDLLRGLQVSVWDDATGAWHSLHERIVSASFGDQAVLAPVADAGILSHPPMNRVPGADTNPYYVHEVLAGWDGWSLSAPRPWLAADDPTLPPPAPTDPALEVKSTALPKSLPVLRYGRKYAFRIAGVDLAGNTVQADPAPAAPNAALVNDAAAHLNSLRGAATTRDGKTVAAACHTAGTLLPAGTADGRRGDIEAAIASAVGKSGVLRRHPELDASAETLAALVPVAADATTATAPRPFLRWDPIVAPTLVPRTAYTTGESLQRMVIRTGLTGTPGDCQRHVAAPKGSQLEAEQDGRFDQLMARGQQVRAYAAALKERGSMFYQFIQDLDNPSGTVEQPGIALLSAPNVTDPVTLAQIQDPNVAPKAGQYIVHDVDNLVLPYLPDPMAAGFTLVFYEAGGEHLLAEPRVLQSVTVPYSGQWPELQPLRLVLHAAEELVAHQQGNVVDIGLPAGRQVGVKLSTALDADHLAKMGLWVINPVNDPTAPADARAVLERAACDGWLWWLTPDQDLRLVHATARPAIAPQISRLAAEPRSLGIAAAFLDGVLDVDGPSTDKVELRATWTNWVDDPNAPAPTTRTATAVVADYRIDSGERYSLLTQANSAALADTRTPEVPIRPAVHTLPDTRAHVVSYRLFGSSRYREFFTPDQLPATDDPGSMGDPAVVNIPSSAPPAVPIVTDVLPMFLWESQTEPEQPFAQQRRRRSGVRIWLDRPWFSSGDDEMLAVITAGSKALASADPDHLSLWARDPILVGPAVPNAYEVPVLTAWQQRAVQLGLAPESLAARPSVYVVKEPPAAGAKPDEVISAYAYRPEFHPDRKQWFVDVVCESAGVNWPFLRLAVARYQPNSVPGREFSPVVGTDFVQLPPERVATLNRPDDGHAQITLTGVTALTNAPGVDLTGPTPGHDALMAMLTASHRVVATVQTLSGGSASDLDWVDGAAAGATLAGIDENTYGATWTVELPLEAQLQTPGTATAVRVQIEEYEILSADPVPGQTAFTPTSRLVYADHFYL